jgi:hypothetical protein
MGEMLAVLLSFPTILFTGLLSLTVFYWLFVIVGALDTDALGAADGAGHGMEGAVKGALEGAMKGGLEGAADAVGHGHVGHGHGHGDADLDLDVEGADAGLLAALRLRDAPMTVVISFFALFGWLITGLYGLTFGVPGWLFGSLLLLGTCVVSLVMTSLAIRPLAPAFKTQGATKNPGLVGKIAEVSTGEVTSRFGQATLNAGGSPFILQIRDTSDTLKRGDKVVLVHWDAASNAFHVEKMPDSISSLRLSEEAQAEADALLAEPAPRDDRRVE